MLEKIDLNLKLDKKSYKEEISGLEKHLQLLQRKIKELKIPVLIVLEGFSASGKGNLISRVLYPLDPRDFNVYTMGKQTEDAEFRPFLWSFWTKTPSHGRITIFDKSWHRMGLSSGVVQRKLTEKEAEGFVYDVNAFEKQLTDDGTLIIKLFLHISKEEQKNRFKDLMKNPATSWRVSESDLDQNKHYDECLSMFQNMIQLTNSGECPWFVIEANDRYYAAVKAFKIIIGRIEEEIVRRENKPPQIISSTSLNPPNISILNSVNPNQFIQQKEYKSKLMEYQQEMAEIGYRLYSKRKSVIIVYEGWDASGKGGNIKRLTQELDPRGYEVVPVSAPTQEELAHHYLWRFYNKLPKDGHLGIFDRSWYGRVLVERIEGYCSNADWQRAYKEINDFEQHLHNHGTIIFKFWFHVDKDIQLERFRAREADILKQYKITDEDWRNREKWDEYLKAVDEMLFRTSTEYAPWTIIESNDKKFARIKTLEIVTKGLNRILK